MSDRRLPKRRCASRHRNDALPSAVHYVGYVEDDETPESIARKFEELERIQTAARSTASGAQLASNVDDAARSSDGTATPELQVSAVDGHAMDGLTDEQLMEVFKQTSIFTVRSAADGNQALMQRDRSRAEEDGYRSGDEFLGSDDEDIDMLRGFWSDEDDQQYSDHWKKLKKQRQGQQKSGVARAPRERGTGTRRHDTVTHYNPITQALIRRKMRPVDPDAVTRIQIPPQPLPLSWGRTVLPYVPPHLCNPPIDQPVEDPFSRTYQAVLVNPGWAAAGCASDADQLATFSALPIEQLCPVGFVFVWADKRHLHAIVRQMYRWAFVYVENLTWVQMAPNNRSIRLPAEYARGSHITLLMFRKDGLGKDIELRHQRKPDVFFDCVRSVPEMKERWFVPEEAYVALETLLPTGRGNFLELWSLPGSGRDGWTQVVDVPSQRI